MKNSLKRIFYLQVGLFILSIIIFAFFMFYQQAIKNRTEMAISNFKSELLLLTKSTEYKVLSAKENVKALASRTMIRKSLYAYYTGEITLDAVRDYTKQKYIDGAKVYNNIKFAVRTNLDGVIIADYNSGNFEIPEFKEGEEILFIKKADGCNIYITEKIIHNGVLIGKDSGLFYLDCFEERETNLLDKINISRSDISDTHIKTYSFSYPIGNTGYFLTAELNQNTLDKQKQDVLKRTIIRAAVLFAFVFLISYFTIFRLTLDLVKKLNSTNLLLANSLDEKELLMREIQHRIKNNFAAIGSLLSLQVNSISNPEAISVLQDAIGRVDSMQLLYEKLLLTDDYQILSVKEYLDSLVDDIIRLFPENNKLTVKKQIADFQIDLKRLSPIGIIVNELLTNVMKYAFEGRDSCIIEVDVKEADGSIVLTIQDNGKGLPDGFNISESKGFGLKLIEMLCEQLNGEFTIENNNGTKSTLKFNL